MKIEISGNVAKIIGENGVNFILHAYKDSSGVERFTSSLSFNGCDHGCLPMVEVISPDKIIVTNNLEKGQFLYQG